MLPHILTEMEVIRFSPHHKWKGHLPLRNGKVTLPVTVRSLLTKSMLPSGGKTEKKKGCKTKTFFNLSFEKFLCMYIQCILIISKSISHSLVSPKMASSQLHHILLF